MTELLTTRQVQGLLKVDRITIYRMLQDGRLKAVKIGQQWRFPDVEINRLIQGETTEAAKPVSAPPLPIHCLETVLNLFTRISQLGAVIVDLDGQPLTRPAITCTLCQMMLETAGGAALCQESWREMAAGSSAGERQFTCRAGLTYLSTPVMDGETPAGWLLAGQVFLDNPDAAALTLQAEEIARTCSLPLSPTLESLRQVPVFPPERHGQLHAWIMDASKAMNSILQERAGFLERMRQIADLTQVA